jgi:hypothetical protein
MADDLDSERLLKITNRLIESLTSDEFLDRLQQVRTAQQGDRLKQAATLLSVAALRSAGVAMPETLRVSSRYFEGAQAPEAAALLSEIEAIEPGFLADLQTSRPAIYEKLVGLSEGRAATLSAGTGGPGPTLGVCAGGGVNGTCACAGNP